MEGLLSRVDKIVISRSVKAEFEISTAANSDAPRPDAADHLSKTNSINKWQVLVPSTTL